MMNLPDIKPSPGRPKDMEKRAAVLEAAKNLFVSRGFEGTSMDAVAAEAGVSKLTVYSHFGDKDTLFKAAVQSKCEQPGCLPGGAAAPHDYGRLRRCYSRCS